MKKVFLDTETSGLDPLKHQILTMALVVEDNDAIVFEREWKVKQMGWAIIDPYAMQVNKINLEEHNKVAQHEMNVVQELLFELRRLGLMNSILYGHNINFDIGFIKAAVARCNMQYPFNYHFGDSMILALALRDAGVISFTSPRLSDLCAKYGITAAQFHSALDDTKASLALYNKLLDEIRGRR